MKLFMKNKWSCYSPVLMLLVVMLLQGKPGSADTTTNATCRHATDMWGDPDPNIFHVCSDAGQPLQLRCPPGRGFFSGLGYLGCVPFAQWPACRPSEEQVAAQLSAGCDSDGSAPPSPWASADPNQFYLCPGTNATPLLLTCAEGKGFVANSEVVGCADWPKWRHHLQCEAFY